MNFINLLLKKFNKRKVYSQFEDNIWGVDVADTQSLSKKDKDIKYLLCAIDLFSKYAFAVSLKDKKGTSIVNAFNKIIKQSNRKPNEIWVDQESEFYKIIIFLKNGYQTIILLCILHLMKVNQ